MRTTTSLLFLFVICTLLLCYNAHAEELPSAENSVQDGFVTFDNPKTGADTTMHIELVNRADNVLNIDPSHSIFILMPSVMDDLRSDIKCSWAIGDDATEKTATPFTTTEISVMVDSDTEDESSSNAKETQLIQLNSANAINVPAEGRFHVWCNNIRLPQHEVAGDWIANHMDQVSVGITIVSNENETAAPLLEEYLSIPPILSKVNADGEEVGSDSPMNLLTLQGTTTNNKLKVNKRELKAFCAVIESTLKNGVKCRAVDGNYQDQVLYVTFILPTSKQVSQDQLQAKLDQNMKSLTRFADDMLNLKDVQLTLNYSELPSNMPKISFVPTTPEQLEKQRLAAQTRFKAARDRISSIVGRPAVTEHVNQAVAA